jgi:two-component system, NtrC family, sensor kinase
LSVSVGIIRNHGGALEVDSRLGEGTTMTVRLPVRAEISPAADHLHA